MHEIVLTQLDKIILAILPFFFVAVVWVSTLVLERSNRRHIPKILNNDNHDDYRE